MCFWLNAVYLLNPDNPDLFCFFISFHSSYTVLFIHFDTFIICYDFICYLFADMQLFTYDNKTMFECHLTAVVLFLVLTT